jgi:spore protease
MPGEVVVSMIIDRPSRHHGNSYGEIQTDLAMEALPSSRPCPGVLVEEARTEVCIVTRVIVEDEVGAEHMGKPPGVYVTIEADGLRRTGRYIQEQIAVEFARELCGLLPGNNNDPVLIVGLGNWNATPDALGPRVVHDILITRHLHDQVPEEKRGGLRQVAALAPGVLGLTGIETGEIIRGVIDRVGPAFVIAVDALASRSIHRIGTTIQMTNTGIHPGSGVGNKRIGLTQETLGVPVLAIGVPTVVHARTIAWDVLDALEQRMQSDPRVISALDTLGREERARLIDEVLIPTVGDLMVTPKEIDLLITEVSRVVAGGLNVALHPNIDAEELASYIG